jgi:hypothetical protein
MNVESNFPFISARHRLHLGLWASRRDLFLSRCTPPEHRSCIMEGEASPAMTISIRRSPRASRLLLRTAVEHGTAGGAKVATVMGHARPDTANVRDVLLAEPDRVRFAGRALPRGPFLRGGGPRPERERETQERRSDYDRPEVWLGGTNVHYRPSIWLSRYLLLKRRPRQAASPCSRR